MDYEWRVYKVKVHYKELVVGAVVASLLVFPWHTLFEQQPYTDVTVTSVQETKEYVIVRANFYKSACVFNRLEVIGTDLGETYRLEWENASDSGNGDDESYDRAVGRQTLSIKILTKGNPFDQFEIRTRHLCDDGKTVDRVFARIDSSLKTIEGSFHDA
jgi:hypothetical protein